MKTLNNFNDFLEEMLQDWHPIVFKRMFGGGEVFRDGIMFALISANELYFKVDKKTKAIFEDMNCSQFLYNKSDNKIVRMSFFQAPKECYDSVEKMEYYANLAWQAALLAQKNK